MKMNRNRWRGWVGRIAVGMSVLAGLPAQAARPGGKAPAATQQEQAEVERLRKEVKELDAQGKYDEALPLSERALAIGERTLGPEHPEVAATLNDLARLYYAKGDYAPAESLHQRALAIREQALGPDHPEVATSLNNLANVYAAKGSFARAEALFERALAIREKALAPADPLVASSLNNLANVYAEKGDYSRAEPLHQRTLAIREKTLGPDHPLVARALNNLANVYKEKGDYARAEPLYQRALSILEKALGPNHLEVARAFNNLANVYIDKGDYARAEPLHQRALAIREKALGPDHPQVSGSLDNLAIVCAGKGDYSRAESLHQRAFVINETVLGPDHPFVATSLNNLAAVYQEKGDYARAEPLHQRALAIWEKALGPDHPLVASSLDNLANVYTEKGDYSRAEPLYQRALAIYEKALGPGHPTVAFAWMDLAVLSTAQGRIAEALSAAQRGADIQDHNAAALLAIDSEAQKRLSMATLNSTTHRILSLHLQHAPADTRAARLALTVLLRRKDRVLDAMTDSLAELRRNAAPADQALLDQLASVYSQLATQLTRGPGTIPPEQYRQNLAALQQEREKLEADLGKRSAGFRAQQRPVTLAAVQAALPEGAALVEIARYRPERFGGERKGEPRYAAYLLLPTGEPTFADLGEAAPIDAAVDKLRKALADHDLRHDPKPAARALDALLMQPVRTLLGETRWVFVSPDGPLQFVPFGALVDEHGQYLVERYLFTYLTSGRELLRFDDQRADPRSPPLALAAPAFDDDSSLPLPEGTHRGLRSLEMVTHRLPPLDNTADEARAIARLFPNTQVLLGPQATEGALKAVHAPRFLHLATHGFFLPEQPLPELLLSGPGGEPTPQERAALAQRENPLLRSGVALAGFNQRKSGRDDGVLTALEAAGLDLMGTRLVVLSTCESGLGEAPPSEGVQGLRRALAIAGAETQVMSLWQVDTGRTRELMLAYYQKLKSGAGRSEAMRDVQLAMLADADTAHPTLWASFVVSGDFRPLSGEARLPDLGKVAPGARGCACAHAGSEPPAHSAWLALALGLAALGRRRSSSRAR